MGKNAKMIIIVFFYFVKYCCTSFFRILLFVSVSRVIVVDLLFKKIIINRPETMVYAAKTG